MRKALRLIYVLFLALVFVLVANATAQAEPLGTSAGAMVPESVQSSATKAREAQDQLSGDNKWAVSAGLVNSRAEVQYSSDLDFSGETQGYGLAVEYTYVDTWAMGARLIYNSDFENAWFSQATSQKYDSKRKDPFDYSAFMGVTPIHARMFGRNFIDFGLVGGVTYATQFYKVSKDGNGKYDIEEVRDSVAFVGPRLLINATENFGMAAEYRMLRADVRYGLAEVDLRAVF